MKQDLYKIHYSPYLTIEKKAQRKYLCNVFPPTGATLLKSKYIVCTLHRKEYRKMKKRSGEACSDFPLDLLALLQLGLYCWRTEDIQDMSFPGFLNPVSTNVNQYFFLHLGLNSIKTI